MRRTERARGVPALRAPALGALTLAVIGSVSAVAGAVEFQYHQVGSAAGWEGAIQHIGFNNEGRIALARCIEYNNSVCVSRDLVVLSPLGSGYITENLGVASARSTGVTGLNDLGLIVGYRNQPDGKDLPFVYVPSVGLQYLPLMAPAGSENRAYAISESGSIVGMTERTNPYDRWPTLWSPATEPNNWNVTPLLSSSQNFTDYAFAINSLGDAAGWCDLSGLYSHACLWPHQGGVIDLGALDNQEHSSIANSINSSREVAGQSQSDAVYWMSHRAFYWSNSTGIVDIGALGGLRSEGFAISDTGVVVGYADTVVDDTLPDIDGHPHAFVWKRASSGMIDLNAVTQGKPADYILTDGLKINNKNEILALAYLDHDPWPQSFAVLKPVCPCAKGSDAPGCVCTPKEGDDSCCARQRGLPVDTYTGVLQV
ncbi:MAG TPA: hypothetical protein VGQ83_24520, partial [Polyangia bacterium]